MIDEERTSKFITRQFANESEEVKNTVQKFRESGDIFVDLEGNVNVSDLYINTVVSMINSKYKVQ